MWPKYSADPSDKLIEQMYMQTSDYNDEEIEKIYYAIRKILNQEERDKVKAIIVYQEKKPNSTPDKYQ